MPYYTCSLKRALAWTLFVAVLLVAYSVPLLVLWGAA
jgi:hypothetical protein